MDNEIKENNNNFQNHNTQENIKNEENITLKINLIKTPKKESNISIPDCKTPKNKLCLSPSPLRRKSKFNNDNDIKNIFDISSKDKKSNVLSSEKEEKGKVKIHINKTMNEKTINSPTKLNEKLFLRGSISPKRKQKINKSINNNIMNNNDILNIVQYANRLYKDDEHLNKYLIAKKIEMNGSSNNKRKGILNLNCLSPKQPFKIRIITEKISNDEAYIKDNKCAFKLLHKSLRNSSKIKESNDFSNKREKISFTNYIKANQIISPRKQKRVEFNKHNEENHYFLLNNRYNNQHPNNFLKYFFKYQSKF